MGFYKDPYQRFGTLDDEMLRAMRLVVDTGIHSKGWTRDQAIDYMLAHSGMGKTDATAEVERYIAIPSQALAYKIGALTIQRLRKKARDGARHEVRHPRIPRPGADDRRAAAGHPRAEDRRWIASKKKGELSDPPGGRCSPARLQQDLLTSIRTALPRRVLERFAAHRCAAAASESLSPKCGCNGEVITLTELCPSSGSSSARAAGFLR